MRNVALAFDEARVSLDYPSEDHPSDFAVMIAAVQRAREARSDSPQADSMFREVTEQTRRYLAAAYTFLSGFLIPRIDIAWPWANWVAQYRRWIKFAVSFNYDLILEQIFRECGMPFSRTGLVNERWGVPIFKPHGSIDFGPAFVQASGPGRLLMVGNN